MMYGEERGVGGSAGGFWMGVMCLGILVTSLAATVCLSMIAFYQPEPEKIYPVLVTFGAGALLMLTSAALLDWISATHRRDVK
jgi:hypothetical protein